MSKLSFLFSCSREICWNLGNCTSHSESCLAWAIKGPPTNAQVLWAFTSWNPSFCFLPILEPVWAFSHCQLPPDFPCCTEGWLLHWGPALLVSLKCSATLLQNFFSCPLRITIRNSQYLLSIYRSAPPVREPALQVVKFMDIPIHLLTWWSWL